MRQQGFARARRFACALFVVAASGAGSVSADQPGAGFWLYDGAATTPLVRGQFYAGFTLNAGVQHLPRFNTTTNLFAAVAVNTSLGATEFSPATKGVQPGGELGYVFRDGTFPSFLGSRLRAAAYGSYFQAQQTLNNSRTTGGTIVPLWNGVSGVFVAANGVPLGSSLSETLKVEREGFQIGLKVESDFALTANLSLTPSVAVFGGKTTDSYVYAAVIKNFAPGVLDAFPSGVNERLRTNELGGALGAHLTWQFLPGWALHLGGSAGPVWLRSRMSASDCFNNALIRPGTSCGPGTAGFTPVVVTTAADNRSTIGFRGTATLGIAADLRIAVISIGGFGRYDSRIPGIQNPEQPGVATANTLAPARIRYQDGFAYGGFINIRIAIGL